MVSKTFFIYIKFFSDAHPKTLYIELAHGGHLGFYEGGLIHPNPVTWIDRAVVALIGGMVLHNHSTFHKRSEESL